MNNANRPAPASDMTLRIVLAFLAVYIIWGTTFLGIRVAVETIPPFLMSALRFFLAGAIMLVVLRLRGAQMPARIEWRSAIIAGGLMLTGGIGLVSFAEQVIPSALAALLAAANPIWIVLFDWLIFHGKRPTAQTYVGLVIGLAGTALLFQPALAATTGDYDLAGMAIGLLGTFTFSMGSLYARHAKLPKDTGISTASEMFAGGLLLFVVSFLLGEPAKFDIAAVSDRSLFALLYLIVFGAIIVYTAYLWLLKTVDAARVSTNFYVNTVVAVFAGWLILQETITAQMLIATVVILAGVAIMQVRLPKRVPQPQPAE